MCCHCHRSPCGLVGGKTYIVPLHPCRGGAGCLSPPLPAQGASWGLVVRAPSPAVGVQGGRNVGTLLGATCTQALRQRPLSSSRIHEHCGFSSQEKDSSFQVQTLKVNREEMSFFGLEVLPLP